MKRIWNDKPQTRLSREICACMRVNIDERVVNEAFPHYERPSLEDMEVAIEALLKYKPVPVDVSFRVSRKSTSEMLDEFCEERGLKWELISGPEGRFYQFRVHRFFESD